MSTDYLLYTPKYWFTSESTNIFTTDLQEYLTMHLNLLEQAKYYCTTDRNYSVDSVSREYFTTNLNFFEQALLAAERHYVAKSEVVSLAKEPYKRDDILQKSPVIL